MHIEDGSRLQGLRCRAGGRREKPAGSGQGAPHAPADDGDSAPPRSSRYIPV